MNSKIIKYLLAASFAICCICYGAESRNPKAFKGYELYSWKDENQHWFFALLPGTNRNKSEIEIKDIKNQISNLKDLESSFSKLSEGEWITWKTGSNSFRFPTKETIEEVVDVAKKAKVDLHVYQKTN